MKWGWSAEFVLGEGVDWKTGGLLYGKMKWRRARGGMRGERVEEGGRGVFKK